MSNPRYGWWGYVKWIIRQYPARVGKYIQGKTLEEQVAVQKAIDQTLLLENGKERMQVIELVFFRQTHTLEGAAQIVPCSDRTARRWHTDFIKLVAREYGLLE